MNLIERPIKGRTFTDDVYTQLCVTKDNKEEAFCNLYMNFTWLDCDLNGELKHHETFVQLR